MTKKVFGLLLMTLLPLRLLAQGQDVVFKRGNCIPVVANAAGHRAAHRVLPTPNTKWDASKVYKQMVILFTFSDNEFTTNEEVNPKAYYESLFNEEGYREWSGIGSVSDYFKEQSGGLFNLKFDIYGPVKVSPKAQPYESPNENTRNYGATSIIEATQLVLEANPDVDYSQYDWNGDGEIEQVIYVYAGAAGNTKNTYGYVWPNTSTFAAITTPDGKRISQYSASAEYWYEADEIGPIFCGIGTICHEFSHCLGLPDIYPVGSSDYPSSAVDEWDLMDGGNFTDWGWCPPNYSPLEKMLLGWLTPTELTEPASITDMKTIDEGGAIYQIKHTDTEYLLLENRQWSGWDLCSPGEGLLIYYVNYNESAWRNNSVNSFKSEDDFRYRIIHADNMIYADWKAYLEANKLSSYVEGHRVKRRHLSTSPYPTDTNTELTDTSTPATKMSNGELLAKPITKIQLSDGLISFDFMGGATGIRDLRITDDEESCLYNLQGQRVYTPLPGQIYIVKKKDGTFKKYVKTL